VQLDLPECRIRSWRVGDEPALARGRAFELAYTLMLDAGDLGDSVHQVGINLVTN
jgi:hypothetical protein